MVRAKVLRGAVPLLAALVVACSSSGKGPASGADASTTTDASTSDVSASSEAAADAAGGASSDAADGSRPASAFVLAQVSPSAATSCPFSSVQDWLDVGIPLASHPQTIVNGGTQNGVPVQVVCSVVPAGSGFDIALNVSTSGAAGSGLVITSAAGQGAVTDAGAQGDVRVDWTSATLPTGTQTNCTLRFTYGAGPVPSPQPLAPGTIWAHVSCPKTVFAGDAATPPSCDGEADFFFEDCAAQ